jgi:hypothetical protein
MADSATSTAEYANDSRSVQAQIGERAAEQSPFWGIPRMGMIHRMLAQQDDARARVHDSRRVECKALGLEDPGPMEPMGDINVKGDEVHHHHYETPKETVTNTTEKTTVEKVAGSAVGVVAPWIVAAMAGPLGAALVGWYLSRDDGAPAVQDVQSAFQLELFDEQGNPLDYVYTPQRPVK